MEDHLQTFMSELASGQTGTCTPSFKDFRESDAPDFHMVKDLFASRRWIVDIESA